MSEHKRRARLRAENNNPINFTCGVCKNVVKFQKDYVCSYCKQLEKEKKEAE